MTRLFITSWWNGFRAEESAQRRDLGCAAVYLCSDAAEFVSGQVLCVDGGLTAKQ